MDRGDTAYPDRHPSLESLALALDERLASELSPRRAAHSRGVADFARELCLLHGLDPQAGRVAGLAHDLCKEWPADRLRAGFEAWMVRKPWLEAAFRPIGEEAVMAEEILHGPAAAALLEREYGLEDRDILDAVAFHTIGHPAMDTLAILIYCADKVEPGRKHVDAAFRERCLSMEPRAMLRAVVEDSIAYLERKGKAVAPSTLILYNALRTPVQP